MLRKLHLLTVVFITALFFLSSPAYAQHCAGADGTGVCTPAPGLTVVGFYPKYDSLPCVVMGVPYDEVVSFRTPATVTQGTSTYNLNWIRIDSVSNLPCGLCWRAGTANRQINASTTGCIRISGTSLDAPGQYKTRVIASANVIVGIFPVTIDNQNAEALGVKYWARVKSPVDTCITIDTLAVGNQASIAGVAPTPTITGSANVCQGSTTTLGISGGNYYAYQWSTGANTATIQAGAGTYSVTAYANCASATATKTITNTTVNVSVTANGPTTFCQGGNVTLNAGAGFSAYAWSGGGSGQTLNVTQSGNYVVTVTQNGCTAASTATVVTANSNPAPTLTPSGPTTFCSGGSVTLDAGAGYSNYLWSNGATTQTISATASGTYTATVTQNGCTGSSNAVTVSVGNPTPTATANGPVSFCTGGSVTLDAGAGYSAYLWSNGATTQTTNVTTSGNYSVVVTQGGCNGTSNVITVTVSGSTLSPVVTASNGFDLCTGGSTTLDAGAGYTSYTWSDNSTGQTLAASTGGTYTVTVSQGACSGSATVAVNVGSFPVTVNFTPANAPSGCAGDVITLDAGTGHADYAWSGGSTTQKLDVTTSGTYNVTVTDANACSGTAGTTVTINDLPVPATTPVGNQSICSGESLTLDAGAGYDTYAWSNGDNTQTSDVSTAGSYSVTVTQNGCEGNSDAAPVVVTVAQSPVPTITPAGTQNICTGQFVTLDAGAGYSAYLWSNGATTQTISIDSTGTYNVTVTQNGCDGSSGNPPTIFANVTPNATITELGTANGLTLLEASPANATYQWLYQTDPNGPASILPNVSSRDTVECGDVAQYITLVVSQGGCADTSDAFTVICMGINNIATLATFSVQPNPTSDVLNVKYELSEVTPVKISVLDLAGRTVIDMQNENQAKGAHQQNVLVSHLADGIYLLNFNTGKGQFNTKFVKQ